MGMKYDSEGQVGFDDAKAAGVEIFEMPAGEMTKWEQAVAGIYKDWIADMDSKGLPGQKFYDKARQLLKKYE
jgi:hypothetical protein